MLRVCWGTAFRPAAHGDGATPVTGVFLRPRRRCYIVFVPLWKVQASCVVPFPVPYPRNVSGESHVSLDSLPCHPPPCPPALGLPPSAAPGTPVSPAVWGRSAPDAADRSRDSQGRREGGDWDSDGTWYLAALPADGHREGAVRAGGCLGTGYVPGRLWAQRGRLRAKRTEAAPSWSDLLAAVTTVTIPPGVWRLHGAPGCHIPGSRRGAERPPFSPPFPPSVTRACPRRPRRDAGRAPG